MSGGSSAARRARAAVLRFRERMAAERAERHQSATDQRINSVSGKTARNGAGMTAEAEPGAKMRDWLKIEVSQ